MKRRTTKLRARQQRQAERDAGMERPSGESRYGKKRAWLNRNGGFGFHYPDKPWRS